MPPRTVALCDANRPYILALAGNSEVLTLRLPRAQLALSDAVLDRIHARVLPDEAQHGTVLRQFLSGVLEAAHGGATPDAALARIASELVWLIIAPELDRSASTTEPETLFLVIRQFLATHYGVWDLSMDEVARRHHVSRRYLDVLFARNGAASPAAYLRSVRMERARELLERSGQAVPISEIAHRVGYGDVTAFIRAFRRAHGTTPADWRICAAD